MCCKTVAIADDKIHGGFTNLGRPTHVYCQTDLNNDKDDFRWSTNTFHKPVVLEYTSFINNSDSGSVADWRSLDQRVQFPGA